MGEIALPGGKLDTTNPPGVLILGTGRRIFLFDPDADEIIHWGGLIVPATYGTSPVLDVLYSMVSATSGTVAVSCEVMATTDGDATASDSYDTINTSSNITVPGTAGLQDTISLSLANEDSMAAGDSLWLKFRREGDSNAAGDMRLLAARLRWTDA